MGGHALSVVRRSLNLAILRVRGGTEDGVEVESECMRTYGTSAKAAAARFEAFLMGVRPRLGSTAEVGTIIRHKKHGYRGVVIVRRTSRRSPNSN